MNTPNTSNFLRRTAVALAAVAGLAISLHGFAQSNALKKSTGETICTYTGLSVSPTGGIIVTCDGAPQPQPQPQPQPGPGTFSLSGPTSLAVSTTQAYSVLRTGGNTGAATISYSMQGGCTVDTPVVTFADGGATSATFRVTTPSAPATCIVAMYPVSGAGSLGSPTRIDIAVTTTGGGPPPQAGCPTPPNDTLDFDLKLSGADRLQMASGRIAAAILPKVSDTRPIGASGQIIFGEATISPKAATVEISVTRCRGVIDTNAGLCYVRLTNGSFMKLEWIEKAIWGSNTDSIANAYKLCKAYQTDGPFYVNVRYTYSPADCTWGGTCGYTDQWNYAAY